MFDFGKFLEQKRLEKGITQKTLAEKANIERSTLHRWIEGKNYPRLNDLYALADALDISVVALATGGNNENPSNGKTVIAPTPQTATQPETDIITAVWKTARLLQVADLNQFELQAVLAALQQMEAFLQEKNEGVLCLSMNVSRN